MKEMLFPDRAERGMGIGEIALAVHRRNLISMPGQQHPPLTSHKPIPISHPIFTTHRLVTRMRLYPACTTTPPDNAANAPAEKLQPLSKSMESAIEITMHVV